MKKISVLALNGSPRKNGNSFIALDKIGQELAKSGIDFEIVQVGHLVIRGCVGCGMCAKNSDEKCVIATDEVNNVVQKMKNADGIIISSPVYFSGIAGTMKSFLDRAFYVCGVNGSLLRHKVGAAVVSVRRGGGVTTFDQLNHYLTYAEMFLPTSNYWNIIHGRIVGDAEFDAEGGQIMEILARNMVYLLQIKAESKIIQPEKTPKIWTHFVRDDLR